MPLPVMSGIAAASWSYARASHARPDSLHQCEPLAACCCPTQVHRARSQNCVYRAVPGDRPCGLEAAGLPCPDPNLQTNRPGSTPPPKPPQAGPSPRPCTDREKHRATRGSEDGFAVEPATLASDRSPARSPAPAEDHPAYVRSRTIRNANTANTPSAQASASPNENLRPFWNCGRRNCGYRISRNTTPEATAVTTSAST
jgi:hypothetical protein